MWEIKLKTRLKGRGYDLQHITKTFLLQKQGNEDWTQEQIVLFYQKLMKWKSATNYLFENNFPPMNKLQLLKDKIYALVWDQIESKPLGKSLNPKAYWPITPTHILRCLWSDYAMDGEGYIWKYDEEREEWYGQWSFITPPWIKLDLINFSIDKLDEETIEFLLNNIK